MIDHIPFVVSTFLLQLKLLGIYVRGVITSFCPNSPNKSLKKEIILVTGGSNGIGREILWRLAQEEHDLTLISWDVNEQANKDVVKELRDLGVKRVVAYNVDVTNRAQVSKAASKIRRYYGDVTMLFNNNAGIVEPAGPCWEIGFNDSLDTLNINYLNSHLYAVQEFLPAMQRNHKGRIFANCSISCFLKSLQLDTSPGIVRVDLISLRRRLKLKYETKSKYGTCQTIWRCPI